MASKKSPISTSTQEQVFRALVDKYLNSRSAISEVLTDLTEQDKKYPLIRAMFLMRDAINLSTAERDEVRETIEKTAFQLPKDRNASIFFLLIWAQFSTNQRRYEEATALIQRAKALCNKETSPVFQCCSLEIESRIGYGQNDHSLWEPNLKKILAILPQSNLPRVRWLNILSRCYALRGMTPELNQLMEKEKTVLSEYKEPVLVTQFTHLVEIGRVEAAKAMLQLHDCLAHETASTPLVRVQKRLLKLMVEALEGEQEYISNEVSPEWEGVVQALLHRQKKTALSIARSHPTMTRYVFHFFAPLAWGLIRAELASKNADAAQRLLQQRHQHKNFHYLDDFFLTRIHLIQGNRDAALEHFARLSQAVKRNQAEGRLDFELRLSCELSPSDMMWLSNTSLSIKSKHPDKKQAEREKKSSTIIEPSPELHETDLFPLVGDSPVIRSLRATIRKFATLDQMVFIHGETGTGKELVARAIHDQSPRKNHPYLAINCSAISETLLESELFGHAKGAFTGADQAHKGLFVEAGQGTLFLDEVGDISPRLQASLLRVLETGDIRSVGSEHTTKIACRLIAATNANLEARSTEGTFRTDLMYRLQRLQIDIPPLRNRQEDIIPLAQYFLDLERKPGVRASISTALQDALCQFHWPGNVRQLRNEMERMRLMNSDKLNYELEDFSLGLKKSVTAPDIKAEEITPSENIRSPNPPEPLSPPPSANTPIERCVQIMNSLSQKKSSLRRMDCLKELFLRYKKLTRLEVASAMEIAKGTAARDLQALCDEGFITKVTPTPGHRTHYFVLK